MTMASGLPLAGLQRMDRRRSMLLPW